MGIPHITVTDLRGSARDARPLPPLAQNFFIFMQFLGKIGQIIGWPPPLGLAPPPLGNPGSTTVQSYSLLDADRGDKQFLLASCPIVQSGFCSQVVRVIFLCDDILIFLAADSIPFKETCSFVFITSLHISHQNIRAKKFMKNDFMNIVQMLPRHVVTVIVLGDGGYRGTGYVMVHQLVKL